MEYTLTLQSHEVMLILIVILKPYRYPKLWRVY